MKELKIRRAQPGDEAALAHIQSQAWQQAFAPILSPQELAAHTDAARIQDMYGAVLSRPELHIAIGSADGSPCCLAAWGPFRGSNAPQAAELICIHCLPALWRQGYGSGMMAHVLSEMKEAGFSTAALWVFEANIRARRFYEKLGFTPTGGRKADYSAPEMLYTKVL